MSLRPSQKQPEARRRCTWVSDDPLLSRYHDEEWGRWPDTDDACFEALSLELFQAGLAWQTILAKRDGFRQAFEGFALERVARFTEADIDRLLTNPEIVRHRGKISATVANARAALVLSSERGSLRDWVAALPDDPIAAHRLMRQHLRFVGPTTVRSLFEAIGKLPPGHDAGCWLAESV